MTKFLHGCVRKVSDILQLWWQGGRRQTLGMWELLHSWSCSPVASSFSKAFRQKNRFSPAIIIPVLADNLQSIPPPKESCLVQFILGGVHRKEAISVRWQQSLERVSHLTKAEISISLQFLLIVNYLPLHRMGLCKLTIVAQRSISLSHCDKWGEALCHTTKLWRRPGSLRIKSPPLLLERLSVKVSLNKCVQCVFTLVSSSAVEDAGQSWHCPFQPHPFHFAWGNKFSSWWRLPWSLCTTRTFPSDWAAHSDPEDGQSELSSPHL